MGEYASKVGERAMNTSTPQTCPADAITSFPLGLTITPTESFYESVMNDVALDIKWVTRTTAPRFINLATNGGQVDETTGASLTTVRFNSVEYTLEYAQICSQTHNAWVMPSQNQSNNREDLVIVFDTTSTTAAFKKLILVIPIIRMQVGGREPMYLKGLAQPTMQGSFSLKDCMPNPDSIFAYYSTCMAGYTEKPTTETVNVFVSVTGIEVPASLMTGILTETQIPGGRFPRLSAPFMTRFTVNVRALGSDFSRYVMTTRKLLDPSSFKDTSRIIREDATDAYKCVALDPDTDIKDGKLQVDMDNGQLLKGVLDQRSAMRDQDGLAIGAIAPGTVEKYLSIGLGVVLALILLFTASYYLLMYFVGKPKDVVGAVATAGAAAAVAGSSVAARAPSPA